MDPEARFQGFAAPEDFVRRRRSVYLTGAVQPRRHQQAGDPSSGPALCSEAATSTPGRLIHFPTSVGNRTPSGGGGK
ncbi:hypothetical protein MJK72_16575 [Klebsiella pneumoniae]|nr:hypothetical protein MJK72_16575 [Klebsiella pneumoniae]